MMTKIFDIAYEIDGDGDLTIEQGADMGNDGDVSVVTLHPMHVRCFAEKMGMLGDASASKERATLLRRMLLLRNRVAEVHESLSGNPDIRSGRTVPEVDHLEATLQMADEFLFEFAAPVSAPDADETGTLGGQNADAASQGGLL